jgi:hypothetical protein
VVAQLQRTAKIDMTQLRLIALDEDDLTVISSHLQDALVRIGDIAYVPSHQRFAAMLNRFDWQKASSGGANERHRAALRFERVRSAKFKGLNPAASDAVLELLALRFEPSDAPSGTITLIFSGDATIKLDVECIETELSDLGPAWRARSKPQHPDDQP